MSRSFFFYSNQHEMLKVKEVHINFWMVGYQKSYLEVGLLLEIGAHTFQELESLKINVCTPFAITEGSLESLFSHLLKDGVAKLIFNDEVKNRATVADVGEKPPCITTFKSGLEFLLLDASPVGEGSGAFSLEVQLSAIDKCEVQKAFGESIAIYVRSRYRIDPSKTESIVYQNQLLYERLMAEFRFNEIRALPSDDGDTIYRDLIETECVRVFLIQPCRYNVILDPEANRRYVRLLENDKEGWADYLKSMGKVSDSLTVYHWVQKLSSGRREQVFDMLVATEAESERTARKLFFATGLALITYVLFGLPELSTVASQLGAYKVEVSTALKAIGGVSGTIMLGVLASALWDLIKGMGRAVRRTMS